MEARRIGYMVGGVDPRNRKKRKVCVVCKKEFLGGSTAKYCLDHKPL